MTKTKPKRPARTAQETIILGGPVLRPYPGVRSVPAKTIQRAVKKLFRERAAQERAATTKT